jgi:hypothetical protein
MLLAIGSDVDRGSASLINLGTWGAALCALSASRERKHLAGGVKLALIGNNLVNQSGLTFFKVAGTGGIFT